MSKKARRSHDRNRHPGRDAPSHRYAVLRDEPLQPFERRAFTPVEDRRTYYPEPPGPREAVYRPLRPIKPLRSSRVRLAPGNVNLGRSRPLPAPTWGLSLWSGPFGLPTRIAFERPRQVSICARRAARRAVLHATGVAGRSVKNHRKRRRNEWSSIGC